MKTKNSEILYSSSVAPLLNRFTAIRGYESDLFVVSLAGKNEMTNKKE